VNRKPHPSFRWYMFEWPSVTYNPDFKVTMIQRQITRKWYNIELYAYLRRPTNRKSCMIYRTAPFSMILNDPYPRFQDNFILWRWIFQKWYEIQTVSMEGLTHALQWHEASRGLSATAELLVVKHINCYRYIQCENSATFFNFRILECSVATYCSEFG